LEDLSINRLSELSVQSEYKEYPVVGVKFCWPSFYIGLRNSLSSYLLVSYFEFVWCFTVFHSYTTSAKRKLLRIVAAWVFTIWVLFLSASSQH